MVNSPIMRQWYIILKQTNSLLQGHLVGFPKSYTHVWENCCTIEMYIGLQSPYH